MVSDLRDHNQLERFLRNASAAELLEERKHVQALLDQATSPPGEIERLAARIAYELRFRLPQPL